MDERPHGHGMGGDGPPHLPRARGFEPEVRHRTADANVSLELVANGMAVTLLPGLVLPDLGHRTAIRDVEDAAPGRAAFAVTRSRDDARPSTRALLGAVRDAVGAL